MANETWRRPGFTIPGYAAAAARKNHELGTANRWTPEQAKEWNRRNAEKRKMKKILAAMTVDASAQAQA